MLLFSGYFVNVLYTQGCEHDALKQVQILYHSVEKCTYMDFYRSVVSHI